MVEPKDSLQLVVPNLPIKSRKEKEKNKKGSIWEGKYFKVEKPSVSITKLFSKETIIQNTRNFDRHHLLEEGVQEIDVGESLSLTDWDRRAG